ncbi:MAG: hypothetical protein K0S47_1485 [Herbinix sp.]|jgi:fermentation-respiration switch protein FrsA (DUF1100 family)|nr:hypothetical protein [Herbinix sp.]
MKHGVAAGITSAFAVTFTGMWFLSDILLKPRKLTYDKLYERELSIRKFDVKSYELRKKQSFQIASDYGYHLACELLEPEQSEIKDEIKKIAVLCHGFTCAKCSSLIYAELFLKLGFTVIIYDHRNHGFSGKAFTSMGYYERLDLKKVIDWCISNYGDRCKIITHGESMGAATVLSHLEIDDRITCAIADCGYSDLSQLIKHQVKTYFWFPSLLMAPVDLLTHARAGFWYEEVSPIRAVKNTDKPIFFIHGEKDNYVPTEMAMQMYESKKEAKDIFIVPGAKHAESILVDRKEYERRIEDFLKKYAII